MYITYCKIKINYLQMNFINIHIFQYFKHQSRYEPLT